ncbi:MAG: VOC family protein [Actinomycetota bacterium]|nr:VOC family protein [Actinomycetota bacterium]
MTEQHGHLHHVELYVSDLRKSLAFWRWLLGELGYQLLDEWDDGESWKLEQTYIVFVQVGDDFTEPRYDRRRVGLNHIAFHVASPADVDRLATEVTKRGSRVLYGDRYPSEDHYAVYFEDPDGIKIELVAPKNGPLPA